MAVNGWEKGMQRQNRRLMQFVNVRKNHHRNKEGHFRMEMVQFTRKKERFQMCMQIVLEYKKHKEENYAEK